MMIDNIENVWESVKYYTTIIMKEKELKSEGLSLTLQLNKNIQISGSCNLTELEEVSIILKAQAEIEVINM